MRRESLALVLLAVLAPQAQAKLRAVPAEGVPGATVELRGAAGKVRQVKVGGRRATLLSRRPLRLVVPKVRAGSRPIAAGRQRVRFRVLPPFRGRFRAKADTARANATTIGPTGGTAVATGRDGTVFTLTVPAGAVSREVTITLTPLREISGLPGAELAGLRMAPSGTRFTVPASLTIRRRRGSRAPIVALHGNSDGTGAKWVGSARRGRSITLAVHHFSDAAMNEVEAAGYAQLLESLAALGSLSEQEVETAVDALEDYEALSPGSCTRQAALCDAAKAALKARIDALALDRLDASYLNLAALDRLEALHRRLGGAADYSNIQGGVVSLLLEAAGPAAREDPQGNSVPAFLELDAVEMAAADRDSSGFVSHLEWVRHLWRTAVALDKPNVIATGLDYLRQALSRLRSDGAARCLTDPAAGAALLRSGRASAQETPELPAYDEALVACAVDMTITPTEVTVAPGEQVDFDASGRDGETFSWAATAGVVTAQGVYTAPGAVGDYTVTATSSLSPERRRTALVRVRALANGTWLGNEGSLSPNSAVSAPEGEQPSHGGNCEAISPPQSLSWSASRECTGSSSWGSSTGSASGSINVAGSTFRSLTVGASSSGSASWTAPSGEGLSNFSSGWGEANIGVNFTLDQQTPYRLEGTLSASVSGAESENRAQYTLVLNSNPVVNRGGDNLSSGGSFNDTGVLQPGSYRLSAHGRAEASAGGAESGLDTSASASGSATATLTLDPQ